MTDDRLSSITGATTYVGAALAWASVLTFGEWLALLGFMLALAGFIVNTWLRIATFRYQRREFEARIHQLECEIHGFPPSPAGKKNPNVPDT